MPIPPLHAVPGEPFTLLEDGVFPCDSSEFYDAFVKAFPTSTSRLPIWLGFSELQESLRADGVHSTLWVDGSYVTGKVDPNDVDVTAFVGSDVLLHFSPYARKLVALLQDAKASKTRYLAHVFVVPTWPAEDPRHKLYEATRRYWRRWWGRTRLASRKGFVSMTVGEVVRCPIVSTSP